MTTVSEDVSKTSVAQPVVTPEPVVLHVTEEKPPRNIGREIDQIRDWRSRMLCDVR